MMIRTTAILMLSFFAACSTEPAGGRGPYDPAPATRAAPNARVVSPSAPLSAIGQPQSTDALAQSVLEALDAGAPQSGAVASSGPVGTGVDPNDQVLNLALTSQAQQKVERDEAARRLAEARAQLVIIQPEALPQQNLNANVVEYARATTHKVGDRKYSRPAFRSASQSSRTCSRFASADEAQRKFMEQGGPARDNYNLDPDGDGFACGFSPEPYRSLQF